jgi:hypothetical protein
MKWIALPIVLVGAALSLAVVLLPGEIGRAHV